MTHVRRLGAFASALAVLLALLAAPAAAGYRPADGGLFNDPWGSETAKNRLLAKITRTVEATPRGETIRIAAYSNDRKDVTDALIAAHRRGVHVQVLLNDNWTSNQTKRLQRRLGSDVRRDSFLRICASSCRGKRGNLHSKFYLFTRAGEAQHVVMFGSVNLTGYGAKTQWNDLYTTTNRKVLHHFLRDVFDEMKQDRAKARPFISRSIGDFDLSVYPRYDTTAGDDPMMRELRKVRCRASAPTGRNGRTVVRVNMYGWNGDRGVYLAQKVADLSRRGCDVRVLQSSAGGRVVTILANNGVLIKSPDHDRNNNGKTDLYTHAKYLLVSGRYAGKDGWHVWTGSQNWSDRSLHGDELTVHIPRRGAFADYQANFDHIWTNRSR